MLLFQQSNKFFPFIGDNLIDENCCVRTKELRDKMTEALENEFKCSICEEMFIEVRMIKFKSSV